VKYVINQHQFYFTFIMLLFGQ